MLKPEQLAVSIPLLDLEGLVEAIRMVENDPDAPPGATLAPAFAIRYAVLGEPGRAFEWLRQVQYFDTFTATCSAVAHSLPTNLLDQAYQELGLLPEDETLLGQWRQSVLEMLALRMAGEAGDASRATALVSETGATNFLTRLSPYLTREELLELLDKGPQLSAWRAGIFETDDWRFIFELACALPEDLLEQVYRAGRASPGSVYLGGDADHWRAFQARLYPYLPDDVRRGIVASVTEDDSLFIYHVWSFYDLVQDFTPRWISTLPQAEQQTLLRQLLLGEGLPPDVDTSISSLWDPPYYLPLLGEMAPSMRGELRDELLRRIDQALKDGREATDLYLSNILAIIRVYLDLSASLEEGPRRLAQQALFDRLAESEPAYGRAARFFTAARRLPEQAEPWREAAWRALSPLLRGEPPAQREDWEALAHAFPLAAQVDQDLLLGCLGRACAPPADDMAQESLGTILAGLPPTQFDRAVIDNPVLLDLAQPLTAATHHARQGRIEQALALVGEGRDSDEALALLAPYISLEALQRILAQRDQPYAYNVNAETLAAFAARLAELKETEQALRLLWNITDDPQLNGQTLARIGEHLDQETCWRLLALAWHVGDPVGCAFLLAGLAPQLPEKQRQSVLEAALSIGFETMFFFRPLLGMILPHLTKVQRDNCLKRALVIENSADCVDALATLLPYLDGEQAELALWAMVAADLAPPGGMGSGGVHHTSPELVDMLFSPEMPGAAPEAFKDLSFSSFLPYPWIPPPTVVNTGFAPAADLSIRLPARQTLQTSTAYFFWLQVGELMEESIEQVPTELPVELLPEQARLRVVLFPFSGELELNPAAISGLLYLQPDGPAVVERQPVDENLVPGDLRRIRMFFPVRTPGVAGEYQLRCNIYYQQILLQSRLVTARVTALPVDQDNAVQSSLDYNIVRNLLPQFLVGHIPHTLSLMQNDSSNGTHSFRFVGQEDFTSNADFGELELQTTIDEARRVLRIASWGSEAAWVKGQAFSYDTFPGKDRLRDDLVALAKNGFRFYDNLRSRLAGGVQAANRLRELMARPGLVQLALRRSSGEVLPIGLIYDYPFYSVGEPSLFRLCKQFEEDLDHHLPLELSPCFRGECPTRLNNLVRSVCPSGFWGFRHALGLPLSLVNAPNLPTAINYSRRVTLNMAVSLDPGLDVRLDHQKWLQSRFQEGWYLAEDIDKMINLFYSTEPHLVYFFCHGGSAPTTPYLEIGPPGDSGNIFTADNLLGLMISWPQTRPLVFINACHSADLQPKSVLDFVQAFVENAQASGVIGTEITISQQLGREFGQAFVQRFVTEGRTLGEALRGARLELLGKGNPLGLVYSPYAMADLRLEAKD